MGLEIVELIMRVEEEFEIAIRDEEAERITTCGALCELVVEKLRERGETSDENVIWEKLRTLLADEIAVPLGKITREARFINDLNLD